MKKIFVTLGSLLICLCGCQSNSDTPSFMSGYTKLESSEHFQQASFYYTNKLLESDNFSGIIYYGYTDCPWCQEAVPVMDEVAKETKVKDKILYVDKKDTKNSDKELEEKAVKLLTDKKVELDKDEKGKAHLYVPEVIVVKDGKIVGNHCGTVEGHDAHKREMTAKEKSELKKTYKEMFSKLGG